MNISRVLSSARQASIRSAASSRSVNKLSPQRGFAVAASQQLQNYNQGAENANNSSARVQHGLLAAAAAAAGMTAMANQNDRTAECCGIAGVVGATGDARYVVLVQWNRHGDSLLGWSISVLM